MAKTSVIAKMKARPGGRDELLAALERALASTHSEEGTEVYSFHLDTADPDTVWAFELYSDEAALTSHMGSDAVRDLLNSLGDLVAEEPLLAVSTLHAAKGLRASQTGSTNHSLEG